MILAVEKTFGRSIFRNVLELCDECGAPKMKLFGCVLLGITFLGSVAFGQELDAEPERPDSLFEWRIGDSDWESPGIERDRLITDRPHISEATALVGLGRAQLETGYSYFRDGQGGLTTQTHSYPEALLRMGLFAEWFELRLGYNYLSQTEQFGGGPVNSIRGSDDMLLASKIAFAKQRGILPDLTIFPQLKLPTGSPGITAGECLPGVNIAYSWAITKFIELECNSVFNRRLESTGHFYVEYLQTANVEYDLGDKLMAFTEYLLFTPVSALDAQHQHYFHYGLHFFVTPDFQIDVHSAVGLNEAATDLAFTGVGLSYRR